MRERQQYKDHVTKEYLKNGSIIFKIFRISVKKWPLFVYTFFRKYEKYNGSTYEDVRCLKQKVYLHFICTFKH